MEREARIRRHAASLLGPAVAGVSPSRPPPAASPVPKQSSSAQKAAAGPQAGKAREGLKKATSKDKAQGTAAASAERGEEPFLGAPSAIPKRQKGGGALRQDAPPAPSTMAGASLGRSRASTGVEDPGQDGVAGGTPAGTAAERKKEKKRRRGGKVERKAKRLRVAEDSAARDSIGGAAPGSSPAAGARDRQEGSQRGPQEASKSPSVLGRMRAHLAGGRFRMLNEALYTRSGDEALELFGAEPGAFASYHLGFREQVARWPQNPLDCVVRWLGNNDPGGALVVADFGCGEAQLAARVKQKVFSLDLVAWTPQVTACNMAHTPLEDQSVDVGVFCLSLMGTDYPSFIREADRTLRPQGRIIVAEVRSRFEDKGDGDTTESLFGAFEQCMKRLGYKLTETLHSNKMFLVSVFQKWKSPAIPTRGLQWPVLKACIYKRR